MRACLGGGAAGGMQPAERHSKDDEAYTIPMPEP